MPTIYRYKSNGVFSGETREITDMEGAPIGWTFSEPPQVADGHYAFFSGPDWIVIDHVPEPPVAIQPPKLTLEELQAQLAALSAQIAAYGVAP